MFIFIHAIMFMVKYMNIQDFKYIMIPVVALVLSQVIKFIIETIAYKKIDLHRLINGSGGMPSSHSATSSSIATAIGMVEGFNSPIFALAVVFTCIVAYDSMGVRQESGKQAVAINKIVMGLQVNGDFKDEFKILKEQLGHKPLEVILGLVLGIVVGILFTI